MSTHCPCCGYRAIEDSLCAVCAWDERSIEWNGHRPTLIEAQRCFASSGACDPVLREITRAPVLGEERASWWLACDDVAPRIARIEAAFATVELDGGVSLEEAELIDDYAMPARSELDPPRRGYGRGPRWQDLTRAELDRYPWGNFPFQDARGLRYHAPAFMRADLEGPRPAAVESLIFILAAGHQLDALEHVLTNAQAVAVADYLGWRVSTDDDPTARRALRDRWGRYLDSEQLAML